MNIEDFMANDDADLLDDALMFKEIMDRSGQYQDNSQPSSSNEELEPIMSVKNTPKKKAKRDLKTNFYFPSKLILEAKIYCLKHGTTLTALMNELLEERLYGKKEERQKEGIAEKRNVGKEKRKKDGKKE